MGTGTLKVLFPHFVFLPSYALLVYRIDVYHIQRDADCQDAHHSEHYFLKRLPSFLCVQVVVLELFSIVFVFVLTAVPMLMATLLTPTITTAMRMMMMVVMMSLIVLFGLTFLFFSHNRLSRCLFRFLVKRGGAGREVEPHHVSILY